MRLHLLSLPHTQVTEDYLTCAYTQKVLKFCRMMEGYHEVFLYAGEERDAPVTEHIQCISEEERSGWFGEGFDTVKTPLEWDEEAPYFKLFNERAHAALSERVEKGDLILLTTSIQAPAAAGLEDRTLSIEWAVGYEGVRGNHAIFESYAWMHHVYGLQERRVGRVFDAVVPNYFDPRDFYTGEDGDYLLYVGRLIQNKGVHVAAEIAERVGKRLIVAGPGSMALGDNVIVAEDGTTIKNKAGLAYAGQVGVAERAELMANATALLVPTLYVEPFGGVAVEAMMSGCPVVASDWGAFTETITPNVGRRFRTLAEGARAVEEVADLRRKAIRRHAVNHYSLDAVRPRFEHAFANLDTLWRTGWYE